MEELKKPNFFKFHHIVIITMHANHAKWSLNCISLGPTEIIKYLTLLLAIL